MSALGFTSVLLALASLPVGATASAEASHTAYFRYISPRPGAEFVPIATTIAFRPITEHGNPRPIVSIDIEGSTSGTHSGRWSTADGSSFDRKYRSRRGRRFTSM